MAQALGGARSMSSGHNLSEGDPRVVPRNLSGAKASHNDTSNGAMAEPRVTPSSADGGAISVGGVSSRESDAISVGGVISEKEGNVHGGWQPTGDASGVGQIGREAGERRLGGVGGQGNAGGGLGEIIPIDGGSSILSNIGKRVDKFSGVFGHLGNAGMRLDSDLDE
ncbi:unnamed protein product [Ilex paraguariensis]|uniref:Uncharacterized protein n=1 Tax=Ilex paraguariensis TaxID=185542 RepID=A0ABC8R579_9AQUA